MNEIDKAAYDLLPALEALDKLVVKYGTEKLLEWSECGIRVDRLRYALQGIMIKALNEPK